MAGMKFLNLKGWHPSNARNQKRIWIAEQQAKDREQRERDAAAEVRKNAELQSFQALATAKGDEEGARRAQRQQVGFLYAPPPGLQKADEEVAQAMTEDDAVREFRRKMEKKTRGDGDVRRNLERYVGRRPDEMLTIKDQVERFPFLKDAPVEGDYASNVKVNFKPMGVQLRNVRCIRCSEWGHQSGDRECALRNFNPHDAARQAKEDPMTYMAKLNSEKKQELVLKRAALPLEMQGDGSAKPGFEILLSDEDSSDPEKEFIASLSTKEKRLLLKKLRQQTEDADNGSSSDSSDDDHRKKRKRKVKQHKRDKTRKKAKQDHRLEHCDDEDDRRGRNHRENHHKEASRSSRQRSPEPNRSRHREGKRERSRSRSRSRDRGRHHKRRHDDRHGERPSR